MHRLSKVVGISVWLSAFLGLSALAPAQTNTTGSVNVTVVDSTGSTVPDAALELRNLETNDIRKGQTQNNGVYQFQALPFGTYRLTVNKPGFESSVFESVEVQTSRITDVKSTLTVGRTTQKVEVNSASPIIETTSTTLADTIDTKQVSNLPVIGRNVMSLAFLVPGWSTSGAGAGGAGNTNGTFNNMPGGAVVSADFDGTPGISNRFRSGGFNYGTTSVYPRIEDVGEMTIQTAQLDLSGNGTSAMRISIVSSHGTNAFHGKAFEDFRNTDLNANSWTNNAHLLPRNILKLNDFGVSVGGPILKNKLFFFGTWAQSIQPATVNTSVSVLSAGAQQGLFSYRNASGALQTVNVLQIGASAGGAGAVLPSIGGQLQKINGVLNQGSVTATSDPNINTLNFQVSNRTTNYFPAIRLDYNATDRLRFYLTYSQRKQDSTHVNTPLFPGGIDPTDYVSNASNNRIAGIGIDWTPSPTLVNQFHAGYMYQYSAFDVENLGIDLTSIYQQAWGYGTSLYGSFYPRLPISSFYPLLSANDSLSWQYGQHSFVFGASWYREQDHYWNNPGGFPSYTFGISAQDPLGATFTNALPGISTTNLTNAENLYAELTGRISSVNINTGRPLDPATKTFQPYGSYNLDEVQSSTGLWFQDSWRLKSNLTVNYGLRWDFIGDDHDVNGAYTSLRSLGDLWGPTPVGAAFAPGVLGGVANPQYTSGVHAYNGQMINPSPAIAIAYNPKGGDSFWGKLLGSNTVIRTGYSLRTYQEGAQNFWAYATNSGNFFYQAGSLNSNTATGLGNFRPGSLTFGDTLPPYFLSPATYSPQTSASSLFPFTGWGMNPYIRQPYVEQWNFGIERQLGSSSAIEVRYVGNLSLHQWLGYNINEVNIFENGFLNEFQHAQGNLAANKAAGKGNTFANVAGVPGDVPLPIMTAAFGGPTNSNFTNGTFVTYLNTGAAGTFANTLAGSGSNYNFFCNMVGTAAFPACAVKGINVPGAGYPINFWQVNPYSAGRNVNYLDASGSSNYNALQVDFRQRPTHGFEFNVNYTYSHSLGIAAQNGIQGQNPLVYYTDRNFRLNYGPSLFDIRHVVHASGTYDLPFGKGRAFLNSNGFEDRVFGGWTLGTIFVIQSGTPMQIVGGYATVNVNAGSISGDAAGDSGIILNGLNTAQLQNQVGVYKSGNPWVNMFGPSLLAANGAASSALLPETNPGVFGYRPYIYGPHWFNDDLSINKAIPINERFHLSIQAEFLNVTNHPTFAILNGGQNAPQSASIQSLTFGQVTTGPSSARNIEFRANLVF